MMARRGNLLLLALLLLTLSITASPQKGTRQLERVGVTTKRVQQSFELGQADGLKVVIYHVGEKGMEAVSPDKAFKSGDRFRLKLQSNFDGYVYVINVTPGGENRLLFPRATSRRNNVRAGQFYYIPTANEFEFNDEPGLEVLQFLISRSPVAFLEGILDRASSKANYISLDKNTTGTLQRLAGKPAPLKAGGVTARVAATRESGFQTRMLTLDRKKDSTFLVVSGVKGAPNRFRPGEISIFEIRLKHL